MKHTILNRWHCLGLILLVLRGGVAHGDVTATMFQDNMVLQQGMAVPVFGSAGSGEKVTVEFRGQSKTTQADGGGKWQVLLDPMKAGGPFEMTLKGNNSVTLGNVMVGEVWLCAGQSNMGYSMKKIGGANIEAAAHANFPDIRIVTMQRGQRPAWEALTPEVCLKSSATAYYFAKNLQAALNVPVGLIVSSSPGTSIRYWVDPETIAADEKLRGTKSVGKWFNELVKPVIPYGIRGAIWYQGESDTDGHAEDFKSRTFNLIKNYRKLWGQGEFPFLFVQIASFGTTQTLPGAASKFAEVRDAQTAALALPKTAMAVTIDIGDPDWHPKNKWDVGRRLALPALRLVYEHKDIKEYSGPMLESGEAKGEKVVLKFSHAQGGLVAKDKDALGGFEVCGADGLWHWAKGAIQKESVVLSCDAVKKPLLVRYAWADCPIATPLYNSTGLPAVPFEAEIPMQAAEVNKWFLGKM